MALISPGVEVSVIDESQYIPAATNSVPYVLIATAQNKVSGTGTGVAAGTLAANANRPYLITSQRDLSATFGVPFFYKTTAGTPINGYELNEYGLLAAYSALGVTNRCYVQRVDIDLSELTASLTRPTGAPNDGDFWLDTANTVWGLFQWNQATAAFTNQVPLVITNVNDLEPLETVPLMSIGSIGDYAVVSVTSETVTNPIYYKRGGPNTNIYTATASYSSAAALIDLYNNWVLVGSDDWKTAWPTITANNSSPSLTVGDTIIINGATVSVDTGGGSPVANVKVLSDNINSQGPTGVYSGVIGGKLVIYADSTATADGSTGGEGAVIIENGTGTPLTALGITPNPSGFNVSPYYAPAFYPGASFNQPRWRSTDITPEPTGSVWQKTNNVNLGVNIVLKKYSSVLGTWVQQSVPIYTIAAQAIYALDPSGGGKNIPVGTTWGRLNPSFSVPDTAGIEIFEAYATGPTVITGTAINPTFVNGNTFIIRASAPGSPDLSAGVIATINGTSAADFISAVSAAAVPYVSASVNSSGAIVFTHSTGGVIFLNNLNGTPLTTAGFNTTIQGVDSAGTALALSNFTGNPNFFSYTSSATAPNQDPADGRLWYYSAIDQVDIMIQNNGAWMGYQMVENDVRGNNLTLTNATGPIFSATPPLTQTDTAQSPLEYGDLWIDTSDLENYPVISRWQNVGGVDQWVEIVNTDQTTENGILFADARWAPNGTTDPISDPIPTITSLLTSDYLDLDAPNPAQYPQGMLLFNTRRSGYNVKSFQVDYFNAQSFPDDTLPAVTNAWVNASGNKNNGSPYMGRQAQRSMVVQALRAGINGSTDAREEQRQYNLIACPQYPELIPNMVELNNDRNNTAFVIGDTPLRLAPDADAIQSWANNNSGQGFPTGDGLAANDAYLGVFYPSCQTTDLSGSIVVQPPSHMMLRTILRSDEVAYPWLAPAGTRRGVIDNALRIGYVNSITGEFVTLGVNQGLRDVLYELDINPITFVPGIGITNFGNKTATAVATSLDRINVARLIAYIRNRLQEIGKSYLFEPNDQITRNQISSSINSLMIDLVNKRGVYDYLVVCDLTNNTPARIDRNELWVDIAIEPVKAVEFIYIPLRIRNTGEIASGVSTVATSA
jgi:hypothetical protein